MELIKLNLDYLFDIKDCVCCIGEFDGLHVAHKSIINIMLEICDKDNLKSAVITFDPHPDFVLNKSNKERYITPLSDKYAILEEMGIDYLFVIEFNEQLMNLDYKEFYDKFLRKFKTIVAGYDFKFGKFGEGNIAKLKELHSNIVVVDEIQYEGKKIGTRDIASYLSEGKLDKVYNLLGRHYRVKGEVITGSKIGRTIGYPTANLRLSDKYYEVKNGVYCVKVFIDNIEYLGIANFGVNPTFNKIEEARFEVHIFNFNNDIYGKKITVEFIEFIREEKKFASMECFLTQMEKDCKYCIDKYGG